jgi:hypothetical protein
MICTFSISGLDLIGVIEGLGRPFGDYGYLNHQQGDHNLLFITIMKF